MGQDHKHAYCVSESRGSGVDAASRPPWVRSPSFPAQSLPMADWENSSAHCVVGTTVYLGLTWTPVTATEHAQARCSSAFSQLEPQSVATPTIPPSDPGRPHREAQSQDQTKTAAWRSTSVAENGDYSCQGSKVNSKQPFNKLGFLKLSRGSLEKESAFSLG